MPASYILLRCHVTNCHSYCCHADSHWGRLWTTAWQPRGFDDDDDDDDDCATQPPPHFKQEPAANFIKTSSCQRRVATHVATSTG